MNYFELNDEDRLDLRLKLSTIYTSYKKYCILIDTDIDGSNDIEIDKIIKNIITLVDNNIEKITYYGFNFLIKCMSKVNNTDIRYPINFLNHIFNKNLYAKYIANIIQKKNNLEEISKEERRIYYYFILVELSKYQWLNINYEEISEFDKTLTSLITNTFMEDIDKETFKQIKYNLTINKYITKNMSVSVDMINELYDNLKHNFPDWKVEIAKCKDINYTYGNPMNLYFDGTDYVKA